MPNKEQHGVFYGDPVEMANQAWKLRKKVSPVDDKHGGMIYIIPYENAGYESGYLNTGEQLNYITIVVVKGTNHIITAFPSNGHTIE